MAELTVAQDSLAAAFKQAVRACKAAKQEAITMSFDGHDLSLAIPGARFAVAAVGTWDGDRVIARIDAESIAKSGRSRTQTKLQLDGSFLVVEGGGLDLCLPCAFVELLPEPPEPVAVPRRRPVFAETKLGAPEPPAPRPANPAAKSIHQQRDDAIREALEILRPLGVTLRGLRDLVDRADADRG